MHGKGSRSGTFKADLMMALASIFGNSSCGSMQTSLGFSACRPLLEPAGGIAVTRTSPCKMYGCNLKSTL